MTPMESLIYYFPTGTAEGEKHILEKAFVQIDDFNDIITPPPSSPRILVGKKGSGKSAIMDFTLSLFEKNAIPVLLLKPLDIEIKALSESASVGEITRLALLELCKSIAKKLGSTKSGLISSSDKVLYEEAVASGMIERDAVERLAGILPSLAKPIIKLDLSKVLPTAKRGTRDSLLKAINSSLDKSKCAFYLLIDDTDQVAAPERPGHLNRIWGFLLAARELTQRIPNLKCIISLREEVWRRITSDRAGQRDQTDHFAGLIRQMNPSRKHIYNIIDRRIRLAAKDCKFPKDISWLGFFEPERPKMPTSDETSDWPNLIVIRSRERPRDAVQLINAAATSAKSSNSDKISDDRFTKIMVEFSKQRVKFLTQECEFECAQIEEIVRSFASMEFDQGSFKSSTENTKKFISTLGTSYGIHLYGKPIQSGVESDTFSLWRYLYSIGFLNARVSDTREEFGFRHVFPNDDPNLVSKSRWNDMQATIWEISPAYRDFLIYIQQENAAKNGLPPVKRSRR